MERVWVLIHPRPLDVAMALAVKGCPVETSSLPCRKQGPLGPSLHGLAAFAPILLLRLAALALLPVWCRGGG